MELFSQIIITSKFEESLREIERRALEEDSKLISMVKDGNFLVSDVESIMERVYLSSRKREIIVLGAKSFSEIVQNKLLKILEEPPKDKIFILFFTSRASILKTIQSRVPIVRFDRVDKSAVEIPDIENLTLEECYSFIQRHKKRPLYDIKLIVQKVVTTAINSKRYRFDSEALNLFQSSIKAIEYGSVGSFILSAVLLKLLESKKE
jgi:DNA polymerase-3 subunit delta'